MRSSAIEAQPLSPAVSTCTRLVFWSLAKMGYGVVHGESPVPLFMPLHVPTMAPSFPPFELFSSFGDHLHFQNPDAGAGNEKDGS